jgi:hypothetical protein
MADGIVFVLLAVQEFLDILLLVPDFVHLLQHQEPLFLLLDSIPEMRAIVSIMIMR